MGFGEAVRSGFSRYVDFSGRSSRSAYWWWTLFVVLVAIVAALIDQVLGTNARSAETGQTQGYGVVSGIVSLALLLPGLAVSVRRLHDTDRSGWWLLIGILPLIGALVLLFFYIQPGTPGPNRHGVRADA